MRNEASARPFPNNLFFDLNTEPPEAQAVDFLGTLMYVLRSVTDARNSRAMLLRYKDGKSYDELGEALGVSKQRALGIIQSVLDSITGDYVDMLRYGIKKYYDRLFAERVAYLTGVLEDSEREQIKHKAYADGYNSGFADGLVGKQIGTANIDLLDGISIETVALSVRSSNALKRNGIKTLGDILRVGDNLINFKAFGKTCFEEVSALLESYDVNIPAVFPKACMKWRVD